MQTAGAATRGMLVVLLSATLGLGGCTLMQTNPRATKGAVVGAAGGAAAGSAVGAIVGGGKGAKQGAAIGAILGGLTGAAVGSYLDKQAAEMEAILAEQDQLRRRANQIDVVMASDILFETNKAYLQPGARDKLRRLAGVLNRYPDTRIEIVGHTDSRGSDEYNYELSLKRARAVADVLVENGVDPARIRTRGEGESRPIAPNDTPEGRARNRRVEIHVIPTGAAAAEPH